MIGGLTRKLIGGAFILDDLGPQALKGIAEPVRVWQVLAKRSVESRFDARAGRLTPFIGREHEVALLVDRFERAAAGERQAVLLSGDAGMGKSRLIQVLHERLSSLPCPPTRVRMQCSPFHTTTLLHPVFRQLEYSAGFLAEDAPEAKLDKLEALLARGAEDVTEGMALLAPLLSLPAGDRYGTVELTSERRKEQVLRFLGDQLCGLAKRDPVLLVVEDAHWINPATREFIDHLLPRITDVPVLMLITYRPEFQAEWTRHPQVTALTLSRLSRGQGIEVVRAAGGVALSEDLVTRIGQRAGGVPLFIEELTKSVLDSGSAFGKSEIPETLQASLLARLDRLGSDTKELAQIAAVIGREFGAALLRAVTGKPAGSSCRCAGTADRLRDCALGRRSAGRLHVPPRADPGRCLSIAAAEPASPIPRRHCRNPGEGLCGSRGKRARADRAALCCSRDAGAGDPVLAPCRRPVTRALGGPRGDRIF